MKKIIAAILLIIICLAADDKLKINLMVNDTGDSLYVVTLSDSIKKEFHSIEGARQFRDRQNDSVTTNIWHFLKEIE
jgi:hypothetical protein